LLSRETAIQPDECSDRLSDRLATLGAELIVETLTRFDQISPAPQNHQKATYTRLLTKADRWIDWGKSALEVYGLFRALSPSPGVFTMFRNKRLMVKNMKPSPEKKSNGDELAGNDIDL